MARTVEYSLSIPSFGEKHGYYFAALRNHGSNRDLRRHIIVLLRRVNFSPQANADDQVAASSTPPGAVGDQLKDLQKQFADLKTQISQQGPRIVAAGTAKWLRPRIQANDTIARVKLSPEIAAQLGKQYIVLLTNRYPTGGYPWFDCYWSIASDGFNITLVDPTITGGTQTASYETGGTTYLVDWVVVKK